MTDTMTSNRDTSPAKNPEPAPEPKRLLDLSATQLVGGALAAMTSAVIGAQLGVAGTIIGAAIGSLVAGVAGSLYTASLKHTKDKLASAFVGRVGDTKVEVASATDDTAVWEGWDTAAWDTAAWDTETSTRVQGTDGADTDATRPAAAAPPSSAPVATRTVVDDTGKTPSRLPWKAILVSTAAVFLIAIAAITGFELVSGQAISGGQGTTLTQVSEGRSGGTDTPTEAPSSTPSASASDKASASSSPTSEPSSSATSGPSSEPTTTSEPSEEATQSSEPSASSEPSTTSTPSTASDDQSAAANSADDGSVAGG